MNRYTLTLSDPFGGFILDLNWLKFECARSVNTLGNATFTLSGNYPIGTFQEDQLIKVYRHTDKGGSLLGRTVWFVRSYTLDDEENVWVVQCEDNLTVLNRPIVAYLAETLYADKTVDNGNDDNARYLMIQYVKENLGSTAEDTTRNNLHLTIEEDAVTGTTPLTEKQASYRELINTLQELAQDSANNGVEIFFDVEFIEERTPQFVFITRVGALYGDITDKVTISKNTGTLTKAQLGWNYVDKVNVAYVGGDGQGAERLVLKVDQFNDFGGPFGRIEKFFDARDEFDESVLTAEGNTQLQKLKGTVTISGSIQETDQFIFGHDFHYGDKIRASVRNFTADAHIAAFSLSAEKYQSESLDVQIRGVV